GETQEPVLVQALVAELAVEGFDEGVLHWLPRPDEVKLDVALIRPGVEHLAGELRPVVGDDHRGQRAGGGDAVKDAGYAVAGQRRVHLDRQALPAHVIDDVQRAESAAARQRVAHEVHRPPFIRARWHWKDDASSRRELLAPFASHGEPFLAIDAVDALV